MSKQFKIPAISMTVTASGSPPPLWCQWLGFPRCKLVGAKNGTFQLKLWDRPWRKPYIADYIVVPESAEDD
jgi:hypothetical protein